MDTIKENKDTYVEEITQGQKIDNQKVRNENH